MGKHRLAYVAFDSAKNKHAVAIADSGRGAEVRYLGEIDNSPDAVRKLVAKLTRQYERLHFCYEAGPTGYGLHRQLTELGHVCDVVAPTMIPKRSGDRVKTNRRDSVALVKLLRAGELRAIWVPDSVHEAVRDLTRARETAMVDLKTKRQQLLSFLLRHSRSLPDGRNWTKTYERWLAKQTFAHPAQQIVFQDQLEAITSAQARLAGLEQQLREIVPTWTMAPVVAAYQALRGVSFLVAITFVAEVGDVRRFATPQQLMAFLGPRSVGTHDRGYGPSRLHHEDRQSSRTTSADRGRVDLPIFGTGRRDLADTAQGSPLERPCHCLEGTGAAVRPLPSAHCEGQEAPCRDIGDRPRACCLPVGDRSAGCAPDRCLKKLRRCLHRGNRSSLGARTRRQSLAPRGAPLAGVGD